MNVRHWYVCMHVYVDGCICTYMHIASISAVLYISVCGSSGRVCLVASGLVQSSGRVSVLCSRRVRACARIYLKHGLKPARAYVLYAKNVSAESWSMEVQSCDGIGACRGRQERSVVTLEPVVDGT